MIITYKYRLKGFRITSSLQQFCLSVNQVWNFCVETQRKVQEIYRLGSIKKWPSHYDLASLAKGTSKELGIHAQTIQVICEQFSRSRNQRKKCPKFRRSIGSKRSLGWVPFQQQSRQVKDNCISYYGRSYRFFGLKKRPLPAKGVKGGCFVEDARGRWYVCFWVEVDSLPTGKGQVGIDLGLKDLVVLSNGEKITNPQTYRKLEGKLKVAQRANNKKRVRAIHTKIKNVRRDYLHKESTKIANNNKLIVVGNVNSSKLAKTMMAKSVLDAGWGMFKEMLRYKASRHGATFKVVNESFTTQTCSTCGCLPESRPRGISGLGIREWVCSDCGASHDRDVNAAKNILMIGLGTQPLVEENLSI